MTEFSLAQPADDKELSAVLDAISHSLHFPRELAERFVTVSGAENFRALRRNVPGRPIVGGLVIHPMGQYFGGRIVHMGGIGGVGILPEHRASGAATAMMNLTVLDMHQRGMPISSLYPATVPLYRRAGYELAGSRYEITIPLRQMRLPKGAGDMRIERITDADRSQVEALYVEQAKCIAGAMDRREFSWKRVYEPRGERARGYKALNDKGEMEGYIFLLQKEESHGGGSGIANPPMFYLLVCDVQFRTPRAGLRLLELLRQHKSVCEVATLYGSAEHPLLALIPERTFTAAHQFHWMTRIVDVAKALLARGWNRCIRGEVMLEVTDDLVPQNNAEFTLHVSDGKAEVQRDGSGDVIIDVRGLAALYTGHMTPNDLINWGTLRIADHVRGPQRVLETLTGLFAGPQPFLSDMF